MIIWIEKLSVYLGVLESVYIKTQDPMLCRQKEFAFKHGLIKGRVTILNLRPKSTYGAYFAPFKWFQMVLNLRSAIWFH